MSVTVMFHDRSAVSMTSDSILAVLTREPSWPQYLADAGLDSALSLSSRLPGALNRVAAATEFARNRMRRPASSPTERISAEELTALSALTVAAVSRNMRDPWIVASEISKITEQRCCFAA